MKGPRLAFAAGIAALIVAGGARAAEAVDATLQQQMKALTEVVLDLQTRVAQLEGRAPAVVQAAPDVTQPAPVVPQTAPVVPQTASAVPRTAPAVPQAAQAAPQPAPIAAAPAPRVAASSYVSEEAALRANWSKVVKEMDQAQVTDLLGPPSKQSTLDGRKVWYYYYPGTGGGSVFFTDAGRVSSRQSPFGLGW